MMWLDKQKHHIIFLQETYSTPEVEAFWKTQWKGKAFFAHGTNHSCGVMILIREDLEFEFKSVNQDHEGRSIISDAVVQGSDYVFANVYAPNKVQQQITFFRNLNDRLEDCSADSEKKIIIGGDFNITFDTRLDCSGGAPTKKDSVKVIEDMCLTYDLIDIWRIRNPETKRFTWRQKNPFIQRRLDFWLTSDICQDDIDETDIIPSINSDHSAIALHLNTIGKQNHSPSYWKFNNSLASDTDYVLLMNQNIPVWLDEFKEVTDKRVLWDLIKYRIRQATITYSKDKARERREKMSQVEASLKQCEVDCSANPSPENIEKLETLKGAYDSIYQYQSEGAIIRSRAKWYEKGERSNKYFLNLESHKKTKSSIRKIFNKEGHLISDPKRVIKEIEGFYADLYKKENSDASADLCDSFLNNEEIPKLLDDEVMHCEGKLTKEECFRCLQLFECNKSPGNDGLTVESYQAFWNVLVGDLVVESLNSAYEYGELSNSQKQAIITLLEKRIKTKDISLTGGQYHS